MSSNADPFVSMPPPLPQFFGAMNSSDGAGLVGVFAQEALVNDQLRDFSGKAEIARWIHEEVVGERMRAKVMSVSDHFGDCIVAAHVTGDFDMTGLPDPMELCFHFGMRDRLIVTLYVMHKLPPQSRPEIRVPSH